MASDDVELDSGGEASGGAGDGSVAARLIAALEADAQFVDRGSFDIDATRALDKLERFLLAQPRSYVLRLAEAGLLAGATQLRFAVDGAMFRASFDREPDPLVLPEGVLARLASALVSGEDFAHTGLPRAVFVQLAVAVISALRLGPTYLAIESVGADRNGARWVYASRDAADQQGRLERLADADPGTRVYVREAADWDRAVDGAIGQRPEHELLKQHCRFAVTPIFLDGRRISQEPVLEEPRQRVGVVDDSGVTIGEAGLVASSAAAVAHILSHGLLIESLRLGFEPGFVAAIDLPLPRDLSQAALARGPELDTALGAIHRAHLQLTGGRPYLVSPAHSLDKGSSAVAAREPVSKGRRMRVAGVGLGAIGVILALALPPSIPQGISLLAVVGTWASGMLLVGFSLVD